MGFAMCLGRSASKLASSVCGGRVRSISTVFNHPRSPLRPFVSRRFFYSAVDDDYISAERTILRMIDSEYKDIATLDDGTDLITKYLLSMFKDHSRGRYILPASFPFEIEDISGNTTITLTKEFNGEHIKLVVSMPLLTPFNQSIDAPSNRSNDSDYDDDDDENAYVKTHMTTLPFVVTVTKKSGRSLNLSCRLVVDPAYQTIHIDTIHVNLPGHSLEDPKVIRDMDDLVGMDHEDMKGAFIVEYLTIRGVTHSTIDTIFIYMMNKIRLDYWLWLNSVKEFLEE
ncbi:hypothetical protein V5N11_020317 [Cardamine amara subsp. amara]|uniref:Uncharacterized protein n=1 Tax=Cardamine amara subsp. amara TaxID=228776 RepID=A0ABD1C397_CARAN